jgi:hypothetical protein
MTLNPIFGVSPLKVLYGYTYQMAGPQGIVTVLVTTESLQDIESPPADDIARLYAHKSTFDGIASAKFYAGLIEANGEIHVMSRDLMTRK